MQEFLINIDEEQKEFIEQALFEKVKHNPIAEPLLGMFKEAVPCYPAVTNKDIINDFSR